jgi:hypothetical protein
MAPVLARARLVLDILSMKVFLRALRLNDDFADAHLFFFDRYSTLAEFHRRGGRPLKAAKFDAIAEAHYRAAPDDDDPPEAAAMAMPAPPRRIITHAVASRHLIRQPRRERRRGRTPVGDRC